MPGGTADREAAAAAQCTAARTRNAQILGNCFGWKEPWPILEIPYLVSSVQNLNWDIFVAGRFRNVALFWPVPNRTPVAFFYIANPKGIYDAGACFETVQKRSKFRKRLTTKISQFRF
jgi:hypothetical protein